MVPLKPLSDKKWGKSRRFSDSKSDFSIISYKQEMRKSLLERTHQRKNSLNEHKHDIINLYLISQIFQGYRFKSDIVIFALRVG